MHPFVVEIPVNNPEFQEAMNDYHKEVNDYIGKLAKELGIADMQAGDIWYLRSRWTQALENRIIAAHKATGKCIICTSGEEEETLKQLGY